MKRILIGILMGIGILCTVFFWPESTTSAAEQNSEEIELEATDDLDISGLISALKKAEAEIEDEDLKRYYRLLIDKYDLEESVSGNSTELFSTDVLPDIDHVVRTAIAVPLQEADGNISDPEIRIFYRQFLDDVGWEFEWDKEQ